MLVKSQHALPVDTPGSWHSSTSVRHLDFPILCCTMTSVITRLHSLLFFLLLYTEVCHSTVPWNMCPVVILQVFKHWKSCCPCFFALTICGLNIVNYTWKIIASRICLFSVINSMNATEWSVISTRFIDNYAQAQWQPAMNKPSVLFWFINAWKHTVTCKCHLQREWEVFFTNSSLLTVLSWPCCGSGSGANPGNTLSSGLK